MNRRKLLVAGLCAAGVVGLSSAGVHADNIAPKTLEFLEATTISGYVEASYVYNVTDQVTGKTQHRASDSDVTPQSPRKFSGVGGANQLRAFDRNHGFTLHALKLVFEKPLGEEDYAAGYRTDLIFGQDAQQLGRAEGSGSPFFDPEEDDVNGEFPDAYGAYIEQAYIAFRLPVGNGIDFKFGRFVALSGYEVIESPANLNFSRGLLFTLAAPIGHTGIVGSYRFNDSFDAQLGLVNGWNTWVDDDADPAVIARIGWRNAAGTTSLAVSGYYGQARYVDSAYESGVTQSGERWFVDLVANFKPQEKVLIGFEALAGNQEGNDTPDDRATWWGVAGYLKFQLTEKVSIAGRAEYLHDADGFLIDDDHGSFDSTHEDADSEVEMWSLTGTVNFDVWRNMLLRFEVRYDQATTSKLSPADNPPYDPSNSQLTFAVDAVYSF